MRRRRFTARPVGGIGRRRLPGGDHHRFDGVTADGAPDTRAGCVDQPVETIGGESRAPHGHRDRVDHQLRSDVLVGPAFITGQHDSTSQGQRLGRRMSPSLMLQGLALVAAQLDLDGRSTTTCHGLLLLSGFLPDRTRPGYRHFRIPRCLSGTRLQHISGGGQAPLPASSQRHPVLGEVVGPAEPPLVRRRSMTSRANGQARRERRARNHVRCTKPYFTNSPSLN